MTAFKRIHLLPSFVAAWLLCLAVATGVQAHDDPPGHYLETGLLYPAFADRPAPELELQLTAILELSAERGYPVKVALVANEADLDDPEMLGEPQRYAELIATQLSETRVLKAPIVVITPFGIGVAGAQLRDGRLVPVEVADSQELTDGIRVPAPARGDDLARIALTAVRQIATTAGRPLPAVVPVRSAYVPPSPATTVAGGTPGAITDDVMAWLPAFIFIALFFGAWLFFESWRLVSERRAVPKPCTNPPVRGAGRQSAP